MQHFNLLRQNILVEPLVSQIAEHPELWDQHPQRTRWPLSPHSETSDIWVRFRDPADIKSTVDFGTPHFAVFYPAWRALPAMQPIVFDLMRDVRAVYLGGILITRIPAGRRVRPHNDRGSWHAEFLNTKVYIVLKANKLCTNWCMEERVVMRAGEAWAFNNLLDHGVLNDGDDDRLALIVTMRCEP